ncbi:hypothetical protein M569_16473, partial [Genlisea aurea]
RSVVSENPSNAAAAKPGTPRGGRTRTAAKSDSDSPSPQQNVRSSVDKSPKTIAPKKATATAIGRSPNLSTPPEVRNPSKTITRISKPSELQSQLDTALENIKEANEKLLLAEKEKERAVEESKQWQRNADEANEKLREALAAQKRAEEDSEIEKFRAIELEEANIEATQKKQEEWMKEIEDVRNQHALDVAALFTATQELQKAAQELAMTRDAKIQALSHAEEATKIAEANAERVEALSAELAHVKSLIRSQDESAVTEKDDLLAEAKLEIESLRRELEKAGAKSAEKDQALEQLNVDLEAASMAESYARNLVDELHSRAEELALQSENAKNLERSASLSLESVMKQLERSNDSLHASEVEVAALREKVGLLEIASRRQKSDLDESEHRVKLAKQEVSENGKKIESLNAELETLKEEKNQFLNNEKLAAACVRNLLEEKNKLIDELETSRDEEEKSKKALESLASALHEVSAEARDAKEKLLSSEVEIENYGSQIDDLNLVLQATNEKYESLLYEAKKEIDALTSSVQRSKAESLEEKARMENEVARLADLLEEKALTENEVARLADLLKAAEEEASAAREAQVHWKASSEAAESEIVYLKQVIGDAKAESMKYKESLHDRENELSIMARENEELRQRESDSKDRVEELSKLLDEALKKNGEASDESEEKDYAVLPKVVEFSEENGAETTGNGKLHHEVDDLKTWESCKIEEEEEEEEEEEQLRKEEEHEEEEDSKTEDYYYDEVNNNGGISSSSNGSPSSKQQLQSSSSGGGVNEKKKKKFLQKFGSILKKKGSSSS